MEKLSPSAECLLVAFCQKHTIELIQLADGYIAELNHQFDGIYAVAPTKLEAVRKLCKQLNILCEL